MIVKNEENRYLSKMLQQSLPAIDEVLIIDDASTDRTAEMCEKSIKRYNKKGEVIKLKESLFHKEYELRKMQWNLSLECKPKWIIILDADEVLEERAAYTIPFLVGLDSADLITFRIFDMWDEKHYRDDELWSIHNRNIPRLVRVEGVKPATNWINANQHCGGFPPGFLESCKHRMDSNLKIQHMGWSSEEDRKVKYERYMRLDPEGKTGSLRQYQSILDPNPCLKEW